MGSLGYSDTMSIGSMTLPDADGRYVTPLPLGTPMRPSTVTSAYSSSFELLPGRPPTAPISLRSTEEAEEAAYARRVLRSASMPYLYRPVNALPRAPPTRHVRDAEELDYEVDEVARLPNLVSLGLGYDIAGATQFDLSAVTGPKPGRGVSRPRTFKEDTSDD